MDRRGYLGAAAGWMASVAAPLRGLDAPAVSPPAGLRLFLLAGQSNMAGRAPIRPDETIRDPRIWRLDDAGRWEPATEPLHHDRPPGRRGSGPGLAFARALLAHEPEPSLGLLPCAVGGSALASWLPGGVNYRRLIERARLARERGNVQALLWHQGETDAKEERTAATYGERFATFARVLRSELGVDLPIIVGELGAYLSASPAHPFAARVNAEIGRLPGRVPWVAVVSGRGLRDHGDGVHFDNASQRLLGQRYAEAWRAFARAPSR